MREIPIVHGMWIGNKLSAIELLTINSFIRHGYKFYLWVYDEIRNAPSTVTLKNANDIVVRDEVFKYTTANKFGHGKGSYAGFSDLFRYKLLYEYGGIWVDMDMTCLSPLDHKSPYRFRYHKHLGAVGNYLECPPKSAIMQWCYQKAANTMDAKNTDWLLPIRILNEGIQEFELESNIFRGTNEDSFPQVEQLLKGKRSLSTKWKLLHWMNEEFRRIGIPKDSCIDGSALHGLCLDNNIDIRVLSGKEAIDYHWKTGRFNYLWLNLKARVTWYTQRGF